MSSSIVIVNHTCVVTNFQNVNLTLFVTPCNVFLGIIHLTLQSHANFIQMSVSRDNISLKKKDNVLFHLLTWMSFKSSSVLKIYVNLSIINFHYISHHNDIKHHMKLNTMFSVVNLNVVYLD